MKGITGSNFLDTVKVLKVKYGVSYTALSEASKINHNTLRGAIMNGYGAESLVDIGAYNLKNYYLGESR